MWKVINTSVAGTSHLDSGIPCQDKSMVAVTADANGWPCLICLAADGAGSAIKGGRGADLACTTGMTLVKSALKNGRTLDRNLITEIISQIRAAIFDHIQDKRRSGRDYACTFVGAVLTENRAAFFQIGDGAIVVSKNRIHGVVFWPDTGQYANMTRFITDDDALAHLHITVSNTRFDSMAVLSDGLQNLALVFKKKIPHVPFFSSMLATLGKTPWARLDNLNAKLARFLESRDVNDRTDDDKTLILVARVDG